MLNFVCWSLVIAAFAAFGLALAQKWGWIEWAQVHAPSDFLYKLVSCHFCTTWWTCVVLCLLCALIFWDWTIILAAPAATMVGIRLW